MKAACWLPRSTFLRMFIVMPGRPSGCYRSRTAGEMAREKLEQSGAAPTPKKASNSISSRICFCKLGFRRSCSAPRSIKGEQLSATSAGDPTQPSSDSGLPSTPSHPQPTNWAPGNSASAALQESAAGVNLIPNPWRREAWLLGCA